MRDALRALPKVELHQHLETALRLRRLAEAGHPDKSVIEEPHLIADPAQFSGYSRLRRMRYAGRAGRIPDELYTREHIRRITLNLLSEQAAENVRYMEVRVGGRRGFTLLGVRGMLEAMTEAIAEAERRLGIKSGIILTLVRERGPDEAEALVREGVACTGCRVVGVDLAGDEENFPPAIFAKAVDVAREAGWGVTVHAGEFTGPAGIWTAIYQLGAQRIGHGVRAVEDSELLAHLREHRITLEICPTSNMRLGLYHSLAEHPIGTLMEAGVPVTVNSDDPLLLGVDLTHELAGVAAAFNLSLEGIVGLMRNAAQAAFLPDAERRTLEQQVTAAPASR